MQESRRIILRNSYRSSGRLEDMCVCFMTDRDLTPISTNLDQHHLRAGRTRPSALIRYYMQQEAELRPLLSILQDKELIKRGIGSYPAARGEQLTRLLIQEGRHVCPDNHP